MIHLKVTGVVAPSLSPIRFKPTARQWTFAQRVEIMLTFLCRTPDLVRKIVDTLEKLRKRKPGLPVILMDDRREWLVG